MAQTSKPTAYFLHSFELKAPPDGPLTLGRIISDSGDPLSSITSSPPRPIPEHLLSPTVETNGTGDQGIPVKTLDGIGGYNYPEIGHPRSNDFRLVIGEIQTIHFTPNETYVEQSLQDEQVRMYQESRVTSNLFMIVGLKIARRVTAVGSLTEEREESVVTKSPIHESLPDFVFAYGLMRIKLSGIQRKPQIVPLERVYVEDEWEPDQKSEHEEESENENEVLSEDQIPVIEGGAAENGVAKFKVEDENEELVEEKRPVAKSGMVENDVAGKNLEDEKDFSAPLPRQEIAGGRVFGGEASGGHAIGDASLGAGDAYGGVITYNKTVLKIGGGTATKRISLVAIKRAKRDDSQAIAIGGGRAEGTKLIIDEDEGDVEAPSGDKKPVVAEDDMVAGKDDVEEPVLRHEIDAGHAEMGSFSLDSESLVLGGGKAKAPKMTLQHLEELKKHFAPSAIVSLGGAKGEGSKFDLDEEVVEAPVPRPAITGGNAIGADAIGGRGLGGHFTLTKTVSKFGSFFKSKTSSLTEATLDHWEATSKRTVTTVKGSSHVRSTHNPRTSKAYNETADKYGDRAAWAKLLK